MNLDTVKTYLLLGSNLGDRTLALAKAVELIAERVGKVVQQSAFYETAAWGHTDQPSFLNLALAVETKLEPLGVLEAVLGIEKELGRIRHEKWGARLIDIDIILYGNEIVDLTDVLKIPHPEMQRRKFVLMPLVEIAPEAIHPVTKQTLQELLYTLVDPLLVKRV
ncbi:MAG: 2-amino-4-hydroxy-6-hydroxymethyldihydropteridine diphosphokinase [Pedobacter sp.]|nr:2-amino-4-hydroxy-6-hydroxymethyldihydropteridine diphosphokinase [Pedobacter sp.]MDQ8053258.1 2-amino-4-hydroxy-6-hydroxymethyldihydropteridine diphosphokinase [Pedobacter sp.]